MKIKYFLLKLLLKLTRLRVKKIPETSNATQNHQSDTDRSSHDCCILMAINDTKTYLIPYERHAPQHTANYLKSQGVACGILIPSTASETCNRYKSPELTVKGQFQIPPQFISIN